ncbi:cadherin-5 [Poeciliopsis prolifica]|uniref:cadherin-5 n=1 Tax=Poeciliopsis prolifica TaxID=188132 RepID=UPI0024146318|nr:cadherin-5 [Poeciliopsis prolifica]XP_054879389.1 cadherin-5 [Poeciliopsis prolifica]XP_054879390.1 cadherin-5 [Poeciliopsis prolifica]
MAWLQVQTAGLLLTLALQFFVIIAPDTGLSGTVPERRDSVDIVKKESHPVLVRQKRDWIWNTISVTEEREAPIPYKIAQLRSDRKVAVRTFAIEGEGVNQTFIVDNKGNLYVKDRLDREKKALYHLTARMYDGNGLLIEDAGEFDIEVNDINDNCPVFQEEYKGSVMERTRDTVVQVKAIDADDPNTDNGQVRYTLPNGQTSGLFEINYETGVITSKVSSLDRETKSQYVVVVRAQDMKGRESGCIATTSVAITITDANDNIASFTKRKYEISIPENLKVNEKIGVLELIDLDEDENKQPIFSIPSGTGNVFSTEPSKDNDCILVLKQALDYETQNNYTFTVRVEERLEFAPAENLNVANTTAQVTIKVTDVDEPPVFTLSVYNFSVPEEQMEKTILGRIQARDPDGIRNRIKYSILEMGLPFRIDPTSGQLSVLSRLDREVEEQHMFKVKAEEENGGLASFAEVFVKVLDINDNPPELTANDIFVCENDVRNTVIGILGASDKDDQAAHFTFSLARPSSNFSIRDHDNNTAALLVKEGPFNLEDSSEYSVEVLISDGGQPVMSSNTKLQIKLCQCDTKRIFSRCKASMQRMGVSIHALIAILLCILTILVIVILFVMRKHYQKDSLASMKNSGEIHEQLVTYDEEGGGEMDTNGYDVSILTSACNDSSLLRRPDQRSHSSMYAMVQKPHQLSQPTACKGDMAAMIDMKKDEADHDRDGFPYDTLHIYGYEGPESLAGSLSSMDSSSSGSNLDYDFLNDWGPRFKTLAELYGADGANYYHQY